MRLQKSPDAWGADLARNARTYRYVPPRSSIVTSAAFAVFFLAVLLLGREEAGALWWMALVFGGLFLLLGAVLAVIRLRWPRHVRVSEEEIVVPGGVAGRQDHRIRRDEIRAAFLRRRLWTRMIEIHYGRGIALLDLRMLPTREDADEITELIRHQVERNARA